MLFASSISCYHESYAMIGRESAAFSLRRSPHHLRAERQMPDILVPLTCPGRLRALAHATAPYLKSLCKRSDMYAEMVIVVAAERPC